MCVLKCQPWKLTSCQVYDYQRHPGIRWHFPVTQDLLFLMPECPPHHKRFAPPTTSLFRSPCARDRVINTRGTYTLGFVKRNLFHLTNCADLYRITTKRIGIIHISFIDDRQELLRKCKIIIVRSKQNNIKIKIRYSCIQPFQGRRERVLWTGRKSALISKWSQ